jgi:DNA-binding NarL/FixJ family response regulator
MTPAIHNLMMDYPLTLTHYFERSRKLWGAKTLATRVPGQPLPFEELSPREFEVFRLLAEGKSIADIARILSLSQKTIANYQSLVKQKLEADTSAQMVWIALQHGLLESREPGSG